MYGWVCVSWRLGECTRAIAITLPDFILCVNCVSFIMGKKYLQLALTLNNILLSSSNSNVKLLGIYTKLSKVVRDVFS